MNADTMSSPDGFEEVQTGCEDSIEVINVTDIDGRIWPGHMARLKNYAKRNNL